MSVFSDLKIWKNKKSDSKFIANGQVTANQTVKFKFNVVEGPKGRFVSLPSEKSQTVGEDGKYKYFPHVSLVSRELQDELQRLVLQELDSGGQSSQSSSQSSRGIGQGQSDGLPF